MSENTVAFPASPAALFRALLANAHLVTVDGSPYFATWEASPEIGHPDNEVLMFYWEHEGRMYTSMLTEGGITNGHLKDDAFVCEDRHGDPTIIRFFKVRPISHSNASAGDNAPLPLAVHSRRLVEKAERAEEIRQTGGTISAEDWDELFSIATDVRAAMKNT